MNLQSVSIEKQISAWRSYLAERVEDDDERERVEKHIARLEAHKRLGDLSGTPSYATESRQSGDNFKGRTFAQVWKARAVAALDGITFGEAAEQIYGKAVGPLVVKAADPVDSSDAAGVIGPAAQDFIELLREGSVYDILPLRQVKAHMPITRVTEGTQGYWVAEGAKITGSKWGSERFTLEPLKVGALVPATMEAVRDSSPSSDRLILTDITSALRTVIDGTFVGTAAATTGTPAGLLNGVAPISSAGTDIDALVADIKGLVHAFPRELRGLVELVMGPELALDIATLRTALQVQAFPGMSVNGGTLEGLPARVSSGVPAGRLIALIPSEVYRIHDSGVELAISRDATIDGTNLFENALVGFRGLRSVNWATRRNGVVQYIEGATYGETPSTS